VIDTDEASFLDIGAYLFATFTSRRIPRALIVVDEPAGKAPKTKARLDRAPPEDDAAVHFDDHRRRDLGVVPQHKIVIGAALDLAAFDHARNELGATVHAAVGHLTNSSDLGNRSDRC
jgi:hypothetical protein